MIDGQFTLGVEEEYQIVDPESRELRSYISRLLEDGKSVLRLIEYNDGFKASMVAMGNVTGEYLAAYQAGGKIESTLCYIPSENSNNFSMLVHGITQMIATGKPSHPIERTLLVTGTLAALMESRYIGEKRVETPHLKVSYQASKESWFAPGVGS